MGVTLSFVLSLVGTLSSGNFTLPGFLLSFGVSLGISLMIGYVVPIKLITDACTRRLGLNPRAFGTRLFEALVSNLIFTPVMTLTMVTLAYRQATAHGAQLAYGPMLLRSLLLSFVVAYAVILIVTPLFIGFLMKKNGIDPAQMQGPPDAEQ
jgi:hypothetical protein